jgi:hypothetical protein
MPTRYVLLAGPPTNIGSFGRTVGLEVQYSRHECLRLSAELVIGSYRLIAPHIAARRSPTEDDKCYISELGDCALSEVFSSKSVGS